ncbi:MAG: TonB-dependent receptor [Mariniphaga sp.]
MKTQNRRILGSILVILMIALNLNAQSDISSNTGEIKGTLKENGTTPVEFASVVLYRATDSKMTTWTVSDANGSFQLSKVPDGQYYATINLLGYKPLKISDLVIKRGATVKNLGSLNLETEVSAIGEVTVTAERKSMESKIDKKVVNVAKDITATGGTSVDLLKNVPGVAVEVDGTVSLRGNSSVSILIDGRPTSIDATRLDQIPSSDVESIEVITNPSAKYNPEGATGIINLKLKKKKAAGLNGMALFTSGTNQKYTGSVNLNYSTKNLNLYATYNGRYIEMESERYLLREAFQGTPTFMQQNSNSAIVIHSKTLKFGFDWAINSKNSLSAYLQTNPTRKNDGDLTQTLYMDKLLKLTNSNLANNVENSDETANDYMLSYKKKFDKKGEELTIDYGYTNSNFTMEQPQLYTYPDSARKFTIFTDSKKYNSNLQINWILPIGKTSKLESGIQSIIRSQDNNYSRNNFINSIPVDVSSQRNHFVYDEQFNAFYSTFSATVKSFSIMAGARFEQTNTHALQKITNEDKNQNYFNFYPNLHLNQKLSETQNLQFSYSRRIQRPTLENLNPFVDQSNPDVLRSGNPDLKPEYINSFESGYSNYWKKTSFSSTLFYRRTINAINRMVVLDANNISHMFPQNQSLGESYGMEFTLEQTIAKWWKVNGNLSIFRNTIKGNNLENSNYSSTARVMSTWSPSKTFSIQLSGSYRGPQVSVQSKTYSSWSADLAVKKDLLKNKMSLAFRISDIFNTLKTSYMAWGDNFTADNWRKPESRIGYISLTYNFGQGTKSKGKQSVDNGYLGNDALNF